VVNAAGGVTRGGGVDFPASLPTDDRPFTRRSDCSFMGGCTRWATSRFLDTAKSVLSFALGGKFETAERGRHDPYHLQVDSATAPFRSRVKSVLSFAYPGKFENQVTSSNLTPWLPLAWFDGGSDVLYQMTSDRLHNCDDELKAAVRVLKDSMHAVRSLAEIAHECVVVNNLAAALEGLELALPSRPPGL
jgi:hypothetical protein